MQSNLEQGYVSGASPQLLSCRPQLAAPRKACGYDLSYLRSRTCPGQKLSHGNKMVLTRSTLHSMMIPMHMNAAFKRIDVFPNLANRVSIWFPDSIWYGASGPPCCHMLNGDIFSMTIYPRSIQPFCTAAFRDNYRHQIWMRGSETSRRSIRQHSLSFGVYRAMPD